MARRACSHTSRKLPVYISLHLLSPLNLDNGKHVQSCCGQTCRVGVFCSQLDATQVKQYLNSFLDTTVTI